ncbi:hypothetical protein L2E82_04256 [Cichorium intybus]|uniref:Uncharacterized protein n=1 Tax=Cichorium intybus TaxID=13427 RepID=A0ACB9H556_CICIN|nr:hypothetical protein L2E82_04256 [Cichorium intybus]
MGRTYPVLRGSGTQGGSDKGGKKVSGYKGVREGNTYVGDMGGKREKSYKEGMGGNKDRESMRGNFDKRGIGGNKDRGGMRGNSDKGGIPHDLNLVGGGRSGRESQPSSAGSGIERPSFHDLHGLDTIFDHEDFESDGEDIARRGSNVVSSPPAHPSQRVY